jgi:hypothetical protein
MNLQSKLRLSWFIGLIGVHGALFAAGNNLSSSIGGAVLFVSLLPWLPLAWTDLPVTATVPGLFVLPNTAGLLWCVIAWFAAHWLLAGVISRLTLRSSGTAQKRAAP